MKLGEINIICTDLARSRAFYCDLLGLEAGEQEGPKALHCTLGETRFLLLAVAERPVPDGPYERTAQVSFDLIVDDLAGLCATLGEAGVVFERPSDGESAFIRDPDGNVVELLAGRTTS